MDRPLSDDVMAFLIWILALIVAGVIYTDIRMRGLTTALPDDAIALAVLLVMRLIIARTVMPRDDAPAPGSGD